MYHEQQRQDSPSDGFDGTYLNDSWERSDPSHPFENTQHYDHFCRGVASAFHRVHHRLHQRDDDSDLDLPEAADPLPDQIVRFVEQLPRDELERLEDHHIGLYARLLDTLPLLENMCTIALRLCALRDRRWGRDFLKRALGGLELLSEMRYFVKNQIDLLNGPSCDRDARPAGPPLANDLDFIKSEVGAHIRDLAWQLCDREDCDWSTYQPHMSSSSRIHHHRTPFATEVAQKLQLPILNALTNYDVELAFAVLEDLGVLLEVLVPNLDMLLRYQLRYYRWSIIAIELGTAVLGVIDCVGALQEDIGALTSIVEKEREIRRKEATSRSMNLLLRLMI
uniref:Uncharacterized protein n=1 Tax=Mycena chlorophos TaxID=658473 RepID=A0ABQ0KW51_MYCCL|nr:predicted protein [Mycena chlorophos]